ncbi:MAG: carboxymuconolactone decarboxylase family protein [Verrucomicrobiota bacterium]
MPRLSPLNRRDLPDFEPVWTNVERVMGLVPNSMLTMARDPELLLHFALLSRTAFGSENAPVSWGDRLRLFWLLAKVHLGLGPRRKDPPLPYELRLLVAAAVSAAAGCRYCRAHSGYEAAELGVDAEKLRDLPRFAESPHFSPAERAALDLAFAAGQVPNAAEDAHFAALREHFTERQITDLMATIAIMGYLNRWNDTMGTPLEAAPERWAGANGLAAKPR